jgi:Protein of unknown function (DUF3606)
MVDERSPQTEADVPRVELSSETSVRYWCARWNVKPADLKAAVAKAGDDKAPGVAFALGREAW